MKLVPLLFKEGFGDRSCFAGTEYLTPPDYRIAVAHGLAIEAAANSRHHDMMPTPGECILAGRSTVSRWFG